MIAPGRRLRTIAREVRRADSAGAGALRTCLKTGPRVVCDGSVGAREGALPTHLRIRDGLRALTPARRLVPERLPRLPAREDA
jgi:hypothetical protein